VFGFFKILDFDFILSFIVGILGLSSAFFGSSRKCFYANRRRDPRCPVPHREYNLKVSEVRPGVSGNFPIQIHVKKCRPPWYSFGLFWAGRR
jgi:hypothetical protein